MTKKQLMKIITEVVRKEVKKEVKKIFIKEEASTKLTDIVSEVSEPEEEVEFTKIKSLNKVLNETVGLLKSKKELLKIIQEVVRREVQKEVQKIFIKEETSSKLKDIVVPEVSKPKKKVQYTKNKALNKVLNETVGLTKSVKQTDEYPTLGGGTFDSSRMSELMGYGKSEEVKRDMVAVDTLQKAGKSVEDVPEHVTDALTRDYTDLMKAMGKKG